MITAAAFVAAAVAGALARAEAGRRWNRHNGLAVGREPGEEDRRLDLGAGHPCLDVDTVQLLTEDR